MLPPRCSPILVTDAGFRTPWFKQVEALGWDWVGRIRNRHEVQLPGEEEWIACKSLYPQATSTPKALGRARLTESNPIDCQVVLYKGQSKGRVHLNRLGQRVRSSHSRNHEQAQREPWLLGTSLSQGFKLAEKVVKLYALRMTIEEAFRDLKSTRFGLSLELHHINSNACRRSCSSPPSPCGWLGSWAKPPSSPGKVATTKPIRSKPEWSSPPYSSGSELSMTRG